VPVWQGGPELDPVLWEDPNPWREAWSNRRRQGLVPLEVPLGDLDDVAAVDVTRAMAGDAEALTALAARHDAVAALVAVARLQPGSGGAPAQVRVDATQSGTTDGGTFSVTQPLPSDAAPDTALTQALTQAVHGLARQVDEAWKARAVGYSGASAQLTAVVPLNGRLEDWLEIRRRLAAAPAIRETRLQAMTRDRVQITVLYGGEPSGLAESLGRQGLSLTDEGGYWMLRTQAAGPPVLQAPAAPLQQPLQPPTLQAPPQLRTPDLTQPSGTLIVR
jgi:hypothetical protein